MVVSEDPIEPGLHLVIGEGGVILRSAPIRNAPRLVLQPPFLGPDTLKRLTEPLAEPLTELVLDVLGADGRALDSFGWPWTAEAFYDAPRPKVVEGLRFGRIQSLQPVRVLRVPAATPAVFLLLYRADVTIGKDRRPDGLRRIGLGLYSLVSPVPRQPKLPDFARRLRPLPLPGRRPLVRPR